MEGGQGRAAKLLRILRRHAVGKQTEGEGLGEPLGLDMDSDACELIDKARAAGISMDVCVEMLAEVWSEASEQERSKMLDLLRACNPCAAGFSGLVLLFTKRDFGIDLSTHSKILGQLSESVQNENCYSFKFTGLPESTIQFAPLRVTCNRAYTIFVWIKVNQLSAADRIVIFRCEAQNGDGMELSFDGGQRDGRWNATLRCLGNVPREKGLVVGQVFLPHQSWHLLSVRHTQQYIRTSRVSLLVDGNVEFEQELHFPFSGTVDTRWSVGSSLDGNIASIAMYGEDVPTDLNNLLRDAGVSFPSLDCPVRVPQSSFDSGHTVLGLTLTKGELAKNACRVAPLFIITPYACAALSSGGPHITVGLQNMEHVEMTDRHVSEDYSPIVGLTGSASLSLDRSWSQSLFDAGGVSLILCLVWDYCGMKTEEEATYPSIEPVARVSILCVRKCLNLLANLLRVSLDLREQFLQCHGFHIISACLSRIRDKEASLTGEMVEACFGLVNGLGMDCTRSDGLAAALQGLLFDFRLWGSANRLSQAHLLHALGDLVANAGKQLHEGVGVQAIIDVMRLHVCRQKNDVISTMVDTDQLACADACHRLLTIALDAALSSQRVPSPEIYMLVMCLEETNSTILVERVVRSIVNLRFTHPEVLKASLRCSELRFIETTTPQMLTRKGYSAEVRKSAIIILLWLLTDDQIELAGKVSLRLATRATVTNQSPVLSPKSNPSKPAVKKTIDAPPGTNELKWIEGYPSSLQEPLRFVIKSWGALEMLAEMIRRALDEDAWGSALVRVHDITELLVHDGPLGALDVWIVLPFLSVFLPHSDVRMCQRALMSLSVALKSDEAQAETLCLIPDNACLKYVVDLCIVGETKRVAPVTRMEWQTIETFGDQATSTDDNDVADVCVELALDTLSTLISHKTRRWGLQGWEMWEQACAALKLSKARVPNSQDWESTSIARLTCMVLQRIIRSQEGLNDSIVVCLHKIFQYLDEELSRSPGTFDPQLLSFTLDAMGAIRKAAEAGEVTLEAGVLEVTSHLVMAQMHNVDSDTAHRLGRELFSTIVHLTTNSRSYVRKNETPSRGSRKSTASVTEQLHGSVTAEEFSSFVFGVLQRCRELIIHPPDQQPALSPAVLEQYSKFVILLIQYFSNMVRSGEVPPDALTVANTLLVAEDCTDVSIAFTFLDVSLKNADMISFVEDEPIDLDSSNATHGLLVPMEDPEPILQHALAHSQLEEASRIRSQREAQCQKWWQVRQGVIQDRVDTERARLSRCVNALDVAANATLRFWKKVKRKVESESIYHDNVGTPEWKLGIAHEGPFPGRKRLTLRPRWERGDVSVAMKTGVEGSTADLGLGVNMDSDELKQALAKVYTGYIVDVTTYEAELEKGAAGEDLSPALTPVTAPVEPYGNGWGLVDADGSDEGFGVVGVAGGGGMLDPPEDAAAHTQDLKYLEETQTNGRVVETGPCHGGTRRTNTDVILSECECSLITPSGKYAGVLGYTHREIWFASALAEGEGLDAAAITLVGGKRVRRRRWALGAVCAVYMRRYRLRDTAFEIFFRKGKHRSLFVDFGDTKEDVVRRDKHVKQLLDRCPATAYKQSPSTSPLRLVGYHNVQEKWQQGELSNFDYLMALNTLSGRSYNDLCQYPVFPWVLSDYRSPTLDLDNPDVYRDLSKPMGAINPERLAEFMERYESFSDQDIPKFMYGSHYSTMVGVVLHFLVRLQPFADLHRNIQNGHFDMPDRLFSSIPRTWDHNTSMLSEVKELTPEWFALPDFLKNVNHYSFGVMQDGKMVDDVELPHWASSAEDFIRKHRAALESDYVSMHLHEWIDLIFGYKQIGKAAIQAYNVFYYLTYYGMVDVSAIEDEGMKRATELQITHFGQCPQVLFNKPHPLRKRNSVPRLLLRNFPNEGEGLFIKREADLGDALEESYETEFYGPGVSSPAVRVRRLSTTALRTAAISHHRVMCVCENGVVELYKFGASEEAKLLAFEAPPAAAHARTAAHTTDGGSDSTYARITTISGAQNTNSNIEANAIDMFNDVIDFSDASPVPVPVPSSELVSRVTEDIESSIDRESIPLLWIEKDREHFEVLPRVPYQNPSANPHTYTRNELLLAPCLRPYTSIMPYETFLSLPKSHHASPIVSTHQGRFVLTAGSADGRVCVREVDPKLGQVLTAGDFCAHSPSHAVCCLSVDMIPDGSTEVIASADTGGVTIIWTISKLRHRGTRNIISRRPQRVFHGPFVPPGACVLCWSLGVCVTAHSDTLSIYSIERDELLRRVCVYSDACACAKQSYQQDLLTGDGLETSKPHVCVCNMSISSNGYIIVYALVMTPCRISESPFSHVLLVYTLGGVCAGAVQLVKAPTCMNTPARGDVTMTGHEDGAVHFWRNTDLSVLYIWHPVANCVDSPPPAGVGSATAGGAPRNTQAHRGSGAGAFKSRGKRESLHLLRPEALSVSCVCVGPKQLRPVLFCVCTEGGEVIVQPLRDFLVWEKLKAPSALSQIVSVPLQAVKGTVAQAQNIVNWTLGGASGIATQAKGIAGEAMSEARVMVKGLQGNKIVKNISGMFGFGKRNSADDNDEPI